MAQRWNVMKKGLLAGDDLRWPIRSGRRPELNHVGIDWAYRKAQWCALASGGEIAGEGRIAADWDGLARLVLELGAEVKACLEMLSGALGSGRACRLWLAGRGRGCAQGENGRAARSRRPTRS